MSFEIDLILLRHGPAGDPEKFKKKYKKADHLRPLTLKGQYVTKGVARYLRRLFKEIDTIYSSPYVRALQTAEIVHKKFKRSRLVVVDDLAPIHISKNLTKDTIRHLISKLKPKNVCRTYMWVGHEPHFSEFLNFILTNQSGSLSVIEKGGFAHLHLVFKNRSRYEAQLRCLMSPLHTKKVRKK